MNVRGPLVGLLVILLSACGNAGSTSSGSAPTSDAETVATPEGLEIQAISVRVDELQSIESGGDGCPRDPQAVAWNSSGTLPGEPGLAVMIGSGQGVFRDLGNLGPDDLVVVNRSDRTQATFRKSDPAKAPAGARTARLELTACGGQTPVKVYAELVP
jgi:hypothetical protein